jgi:hypothetical protein
MHKTDYKKWQEGKRHYITSFDVIAGGNFGISLVEECSDVTNKEQLHARERHYIESNECVNKYIPGRTRAEWRAAHKDEAKAYFAAYRAAHKDEIKAKDAAYYEANREQVLANNAAYQEANADKIRAYRHEKVRCPHCASIVTRPYLSTHKRTAKCQRAQQEPVV